MNGIYVVNLHDFGGSAAEALHPQSVWTFATEDEAREFVSLAKPHLDDRCDFVVTRYLAPSGAPLADLVEEFQIGDWHFDSSGIDV